VREHALPDGEGRSQVLAEKLLFGVLLDGADQLTVHFDLVLLALFRDDVGSLLLFENFSFAVTDLLGLGAAEVFVIHRLRNIDTGNVDLSLGSNDVDLVDPSERASVDAERSGDEEQTRGQLLQEHDALSLVDARDQDQHSAGSDGGAKLAVVLAEGLLVGGLSLLAALSGQSAGSLVELNNAFVAVLLSSNLLRHRSRLLDDGCFLCLLVLDEGGLLVVHLGSREPHDPAVNLRISRRVNHF